jgi:desulfoferrodoxin-like iron-binding protein
MNRRRPHNGFAARTNGQEGRPVGAVRNEICRCDVCGHAVFVMEGGEGDLVCCGENMKLLTSDEAKAFAQRMPKPGSP